VESGLTAEQREKLKRLTMDLHWLVREGYVTEFADGRLFTPPPMAEARVKAAESVEGEEHDLENFPEAPAPAADTEPVESPPPESVAPAPLPRVRFHPLKQPKLRLRPLQTRRLRPKHRVLINCAWRGPLCSSGGRCAVSAVLEFRRARRPSLHGSVMRI